VSDFREAMRVRPHDTRAAVALEETYREMERRYERLRAQRMLEQEQSAAAPSAAAGRVMDQLNRLAAALDAWENDGSRGGRRGGWRW
jgi:hypothetical protein